MAEPQTFYELTFKFTSGNQVSAQVLEGRDVIQDIDQCEHCGATPRTRITLNESPTVTHTINVDTVKLDAVECTKRIIPPDPTKL